MAPIEQENLRKRNKKSKKKFNRLNNNRLNKKTKDFIKSGIQDLLFNGKDGIKDISCEDNSNTQSFKSLTSLVSLNTMRGIKAMGYTNMTDIQFKCIPKLLEGKDLQGTGKTGSGKTLAFLIPVIELMVRLQYEPKHGTGAIIVSPTQELALQTFALLTELMKFHKQTFGLIMDGSNKIAEVEKLIKGFNILVATPGRLLDHLQSTPHFTYKNLICLVIDKADRIFDVGFDEELKQIIKLLPKRRQTMLFSATRDAKINELTKLALKSEPIEVDVGCDKIEATPEGLEQAFVVCPADKRFLVLYTFIKKNLKEKVIVFFSSCMAVKFYHELLNFMDIKIMSIHGKQKQAKKTSTFNDFRKAKSGILFCTDVAAKGLDIPAVDWIVQYDPPDDPKEYIHRVGRTVRAGGRGQALLFLTEEEIGFIRYLKSQKVNVEPMDITWAKVANIQAQLEKLVTVNYYLHMSAKKGFASYVKSYLSHSLKDIFNIDTLDLVKAAKCFGFIVPPFVDIEPCTLKDSDKSKKGNSFGQKNNKQMKTK